MYFRLLILYSARFTYNDSTGVNHCFSRNYSIIPPHFDSVRIFLSLPLRLRMRRKGFVRRSHFAQHLLMKIWGTTLNWMGSGSPGMSTHNNRMILFVGTSFFGRNFMLLSAGWNVHRILMPNYCSWKKKYQALNNTTTAALLHIYPNLLPLSFGTDNESWYLKWYWALPHMVSISNHSRSGKMSSTFMIIFRLNFIQSITL